MFHKIYKKFHIKCINRFQNVLNIFALIMYEGYLLRYETLNLRITKDSKDNYFQGVTVT